MYHISQKNLSKTINITFGEIILMQEYSCLFEK
jgi:hypothetical protein